VRTNRVGVPARVDRIGPPVAGVWNGSWLRATPER
jgi:hypothetical protein